MAILDMGNNIDRIIDNGEKLTEKELLSSIENDPGIRSSNRGFIESPITDNKQSDNLKSPFRKINISDQLTKLQRSVEEKLYVVLYYNIEYEEYKSATFIGRYNTYFGIKNILDSESVDIKESVVLVEVVGTDKLGKPRRFITHPDDEGTLSIYGFCKQMEPLFGDNAYSIEEYNIIGTDDPNEEDSGIVKIGNPIVNLDDNVNGDSNTVIDNIGFGKTVNVGEDPFKLQVPENGGKQFFTPANMGDVESKEI